MDVILPFWADLRPVWETVLGRAGGLPQTQSLSGYSAHCPNGAAAPWLAPHPGAEAEIVQIAITAEEKARLDHYHACFAMQARRHDTAWLYCKDSQSVTRTAGPGDGAAKRLAAAEIMERMGGEPLAMPPLLNRAAAKARAMQSTPHAPSGLDRNDVTWLSGEPVHRGFFGFDRLTLRPSRFDGRPAAEMTREVFHTIDAALVLPYDPKRDQVLLVEQFRVGPYLRCDPCPFVLEPAAGLIDDGETPQEAALREAREETGLALDRLIPLPSGYASPGASTEHFDCFLGLADLSEAHGTLGGQPGEGEDIRNHVVAYDQAMAMLDQGEIRVIPLAMMLLALTRIRPSLR